MTWQQQSEDYAREHFKDIVACKDRYDLIRHAWDGTDVSGFVAEFGVADGHSFVFLNHIDQESEIHGFDSFRGLPEDWEDSGRIRRGTYNRNGIPPKVPGRPHLHVGLFSETVPAFAGNCAEQAKLLHIDCDLYSSTRDVFEGLADHIGPGTAIVFDEYWNYSGWLNHEWRAFQEFVAKHDRKYRYTGYLEKGYQVAVIME